MRRTLPYVWITLAACGSSADPEPQDGTPERLDEACAIWDPAGGELEAGPFRITVGAGALGEEVTVCLVASGDPAPPYVGMSPNYVLEAEDELAAKVELEITAELADGSIAYLATADGNVPQEASFATTVGAFKGVFLASPTLTDAFTPEPALVDVLLVVDHSCGMVDQQAELSNAFPAFRDRLDASAVDYQIGVITADMDDPAHQGRLREVGGRRWIDPQTSEPDWIFTELVVMDDSGSGNERGLDTTYEALETLANGENAGFRRADAQLATIVVSDESDHGQLSVGGAVAWYGTLRADPTDARFHAIVSPDPRCPDGAEPGTPYIQVAGATGGALASICGPFEDALDAVVDTLWATGWLPLSVTPDPETISVVVTLPGGAMTTLPASDWTYDADQNRVRVGGGSFPEIGSTIQVSYAQ